MNVIIVDDDEVVRSVYNRYLQQNGFATTLAENGLIAIEKLRVNKRVSKILLDMMMPEMDGYAFIKAIQDDAELTLRHFEIFIITNLDKELVLRNFNEGNISMKYIKNILKKPIDLAMLPIALQL